MPGSAAHSRGMTTRHPAELALALYLGATGALLQALGESSAAVLHAAGLLVVGAIRLLAPPPERSVLRALWPLLLVLPLYQETGLLSARLWGRNFDAPVLRFEEALFGQTPAVWLCEAWSWLWLSELLHLCYMAFWLLLPAMALATPRRHLATFTWTALNAYLLCFAAFVLFPVEGPRPHLPPLPDHLQGPLTRLCHAITASGAARAAAFPSSHVAVALVVSACAARWRPRLLPLFAALAAGISVATVYGRFHYAVDVAAGALFAGVSWRWLGPGRDR